MLDKKTVIDRFIQEQEEKVQQLIQSLENTRRDVIAAPGHTESHSDTMKFQHSGLQLGLEKQVAEAQMILGELRGLQLVPLDTIQEGALFTLKDTDSEESNSYLLVSDRGGVSIEIDGKRVIAISTQAPLTESVWGKRKGDKIIRRGKTSEIIDVQ